MASSVTLGVSGHIFCESRFCTAPQEALERVHEWEYLRENAEVKTSQTALDKVDSAAQTADSPVN